MKKNLLVICMLLLCINIIPSKIFAQSDVGDAGNNAILINPPSYITTVKRNNGNGTSSGMAEVRLGFSDNNYHNAYLVAVTYSDGTQFPNAVIDNFGIFQKGYTSYALNVNVPSSTKLRYCFKCDEGCFWVSES